MAKEQADPKIQAVTTIRFDVPDYNWEQWCLLTADHHWDNPQCDQALLAKHLREAQERKALVFCFGDLFCAMQGKYDRRASKSKVRPEHQVDHYLDELVTTAANWYGKYADVLTLVTDGNHETAITKNHETNLLDRMVKHIQDKTGHTIGRGGYGGWIRFMGQQATQRSSVKLKYFHGAGGGGPVTRGVIQTNRQAVYLPDADIVVNGHVHEQYLLMIPRERISDSGVIRHDTQYHVRCPTYKDEYADGTGGWHIETGKPPKPLGAWWMKFYWHRERGLEFTFHEAKK